jgi:hypothetical protein
MWNSGVENIFYATTTWPNVKLWDNLLSTYLRRNLTDENDILRAFTGIMTNLTLGFPGKFHYGLPELFFDASLLWRPQSYLERRISTSGSVFPSWSWCGWKGKIRSGIGGFGLDHLRSDPVVVGRDQPIFTFSKIIWYKTTFDLSESIPIYNVWHVFRDGTMGSQFDPEKLLPYGWSLHQPEEGTAYYTYHAAPAYTFHYPIPTSYDWGTEPVGVWGSVLRFKTLRVWLTIGEALCFPYDSYDYDSDDDDDDSDESDRFGMHSLRNGENKQVGVIHLNIGTVDDLPVGERCELIMLSDGLARNDPSEIKQYLPELASGMGGEIGDVYEFCHVMWIEWKDGIAYRKAIGRVLCEVFQDDKYGSMGISVLLG